MICKLTNMVHIFLFVLFSLGLNAQDSIATVVNVPTELVEARNGLDYSGDIIEKKKEEEKEEKKSFNNNLDFNFSDFAGIMLMVLLVGVVFSILYFMLGKENVFKPKSSKIKDLNLKSIEQIEENLEDHDVAYYLKQAVTGQQYRIAIRLHYLLIIKELSEKKLIKWKRDKTNKNYLIETSSYAFSASFKKSTNIFEKVWYGERNVDEHDFKVIQGQFTALNEEINRLAI